MAPQHFGGVLSVELHSEGAAKALPQAVRRIHTNMLTAGAALVFVQALWG